MKKKLLISVIIATKNEEKNIANCIKSIQSQTYKNIEILVIDNNSSDKTKEIAKKFTKKVYNLIDHISLDKVKNFRGAQVNFGATKAKGDIIFFPDADMTFDNNLIEEAVNKINQYDALFIPEIVCGNGFFGKIRNFERSFYNETCIDAIRIIKTKVFQKIGGFDVENIVFAPDDWDLTKTLKKHNYQLGITESALFHHEEWMNLKIYLEKKGKYVNTFEGYIAKWGKDDPDIKKQFGVLYRYFEVFFENGKWKKILLHPIQTIGVYSLKFMVGVVYLFKK